MLGAVRIPESRLRTELNPLSLLGYTTQATLGQAHLCLCLVRLGKPAASRRGWFGRPPYRMGRLFAIHTVFQVVSGSDKKVG
jgi:hypothetical protein